MKELTINSKQERSTPMQRLLLVLAIGLLVTSPVLAQVALIPVDIDIKPGSDPNSINCYNLSEVITVAIFSTADFDATTIDPATVTFEGAGEIHVSPKTGQPRLHLEDVDGDGLMDLVFHFRSGETSLDCDSTDGTLSGETFDGQFIEGTDAVRMLNVITVD